MWKGEIFLFFSHLDHMGPGPDQKLSTSNGLCWLELAVFVIVHKAFLNMQSMSWYQKILMYL